MMIYEIKTGFFFDFLRRHLKYFLTIKQKQQRKVIQNSIRNSKALEVSSPQSSTFTKIHKTWYYISKKQNCKILT